MELRYLFAVIRTYRRFIATAAVSACALALLATYVLPETYEASSTLLIRPRREPATTASSKAMMDYPVSFNIPVDTMSKTYAEIMGSEAVATRVVDILHLDTLKPPQDPRWWMGSLRWTREHARLALVRGWELARYGRLKTKDPYWEAVAEVRKSLTPRPVTDTYLFDLNASANDSALAARIADTAATVFVDYTRNARMAEEGSGADDIARRLDTVRTELASARERLQAFGVGTHAASLDRELQLKVEAVAGFQVEREQTLSRLRTTEAEVTALTSQLGAQTATVASSSTVARNPVITELESEVARDSVELAGLTRTYQDSHPRVKELRGKIEEARARIGAAQQEIGERNTLTRNPLVENIEGKLLDRSATRDAQRAHLAAVDASLSRYQKELDELTGQKADMARLALDVEVLENEYRLGNQQYAEAKLASVLQMSEVRVLHAAVPPVYPSGRSRSTTPRPACCSACSARCWACCCSTTPSRASGRSTRSMDCATFRSSRWCRMRHRHRCSSVLLPPRAPTAGGHGEFTLRTAAAPARACSGPARRPRVPVARFAERAVPH